MRLSKIARPLFMSLLIDLIRSVQHRLRRRLFTIAMALPIFGVSVSDPPMPPTFRAEVEYVEVDALVTDERGDSFRACEKKTFKSSKTGSPDDREFCARGDSNRDANVSRGVEPDVRSNERPFVGRIYTMILDDLHTAPSRAPRVKAAARRFIERHLAANDLMAIVHIGWASTDSQDFTSNKRLLLGPWIGSWDRSWSPPRWPATRSFSRRVVPAAPIADPFDAERGFNARSTTRVLTEVAEKLGGVRGRRKTILFISEGIDYDITDPFNNRSATAILDEMRGAIAAATRSNVSIYTIDPRGLTLGRRRH